MAYFAFTDGLNDTTRPLQFRSSPVFLTTTILPLRYADSSNKHEPKSKSKIKQKIARPPKVKVQKHQNRR